MMRLGLFLMPLHDPKGHLPSQLAEDRDAIILGDQLGYDEAWVGEHYCSVTEPIPDPLQFMASLIPVTKTIKLGTGVLNLPQHHPVQIAGAAAQFDHLSNGRFLMGIGPGGLVSDMEMFGTREKNRPEMLVEAIDAIHRLWSSDPPYVIPGKHWDIRLEKTVDVAMGVGPVIKPLQRPYPPISVSARSPRSDSVALAGERGWGVISANFMPYQIARLHWQIYLESSQQAGRRADRSKWSLARNIMVLESDAEAADYMARPKSALRFYYEYLHHSFAGKNLLHIFKTSPEVPDSALTIEYLLSEIVVCGGPKTVLDRLVQIVDDLGPLGGLLMAKTEWDEPALHRRSYQLLAEEVMPKLRAHVASLPLAAE
jgi:alkanesulfonate monooxygenase SsuD/methylene tetrahydromethanopterin reductase-like flavin-dependent oxidoreductase (luciferase family)